MDLTEVAEAREKLEAAQLEAQAAVDEAVREIHSTLGFASRKELRKVLLKLDREEAEGEEE